MGQHTQIATVGNKRLLLVMGSPSVLVGVLLLVISSTDGMTTPSLYATTNPAVPGQVFTLVCVWNITDIKETIRPNATDIYWTRKGTDSVTDTQYVFYSDTCELNNIHNRSYTRQVSVRYGLLYQSLIFANITDLDIGDIWYCAFRESNMSNHVEVKNKVGTVGENVHMSGSSDVVYTGSAITLRCTNMFNTSYFPMTWFIDGVKYILDENCSIHINSSKPDNLNIVNRTLTNCSQVGSPTLTLTNVSHTDHNGTWVCSILQNVSNTYRVIVLDPPGWPDGVALHTTEAEIIMTETATIETPITETTITETLITETPITETATTETPITETATIETPITETATIETPITETATTETPITERATIETPITETATTETPITETPIAETTITETPTTLICSTRCEDENYVFHWNISSGNISEMEYNNCTSTCTQKVTFDVEGIDSHYTVNCKVINNRTRKEDSAVIKLNIELKPNQDHVTTSDHVTTQPSAVVSDLKNIYIGAGSTVGVLLIVVCIVVIVCCKRKSTGSDKVMMDNVLYTSARTETLQDSQVKLEMEDNVLYGYGDPESTHIGNNAGMVDNVLYTSAEAENAKSREKLVMEEYLLSEYGGPQSSHNQHIPVIEENVLYESSGGRN